MNSFSKYINHDLYYRVANNLNPVWELTANSKLEINNNIIEYINYNIRMHRKVNFAYIVESIKKTIEKEINE